MTTILLGVGAAEADRADDVVTKHRRQTVRHTVQHPIQPISLLTGEPIIGNDRNDIQIGGKHQRHSMLRDVRLILGRVELDLHKFM